MAFAGEVFPQAQVLGAEAVDGAVGQLDVDLAGKDGEPAALRGRVEVGELASLGDLKGTPRHLFQRLELGVRGLEGLDVALPSSPVYIL